MLVLSRKTDEAIVVGENIKVTVLGIEGDKVKIGVEAPISMRIFREELIRQTGEENLSALKSPIITFDLQSASAELGRQRKAGPSARQDEMGGSGQE